MDFKKNLKLLPRKRIFDLMEQIPSHPLSMIIAPMGYGKTASLRSYIERTELESLWMTMPRATNLSETELFWFWQALSAVGGGAYGPVFSMPLGENDCFFPGIRAKIETET